MTDSKHTLELDTDIYAARIDNKTVMLTATEYRIFAFLMDNRGRVCTRTQIEDHLYPYAPDSSRIVDVYIGYLRNKLGRDVIQTRRGFGYYIQK